MADFSPLLLEDFPKMRILQLHNLYKIPGGEDVVVQAEKTLLENYGHEVVLLQADNHNITSFFSQTMTALNTVYSFSAKKRVQAEIAKFQPDIVHVHNFFPLWSPAVYDACQEARVPVLQTLHNYRLFCPGAFFYRDGKVCEDCLGKFFPWPGVVHRCYRGSRVGSAVLATMQAVHRARGTWKERVNLYIALTEFARHKFIEAGLPADKIVVKPNFLLSKNENILRSKVTGNQGKLCSVCGAAVPRERNRYNAGCLGIKSIKWAWSSSKSLLAAQNCRRRAFSGSSGYGRTGDPRSRMAR